jgi:ATP-binding cassette subfamily F protein 3
MREALALALQGFAGALVIVAHDRSLLSRTVDEFWLVENHTVKRLQGSLTTYARDHNRATLNLAAGTPGQAAASTSQASADKSDIASSVENGSRGSNRKAQRQAAAAKRAQEKPLRDRVRKLELKIEETGNALKAVEARLADPDAYNSLPADELDSLLRDAGKLRKKKDDAEQAWLTTCEELENIQLS